MIYRIAVDYDEEKSEPKNHETENHEFIQDVLKAIDVMYVLGYRFDVVIEKI